MELITRSPGTYTDYAVVYKGDDGMSYSIVGKPTTYNCNLAILDNINTLARLSKDDDRKTVFNTLKKLLPSYNFYIHLTDKNLWEWFKIHYKYLSANTIPRKGGGYQYHILIDGIGLPERVENEKIVEKIIKEKVKYVPTKEIMDIINDAFEKTTPRKNRLKLIEQGLNNIKLDSV